jgi:3-deoxy-D-manno-octulosonate 8-phosphate phosphatase (KDO 8-P phosphatase)
MPLVTVEAVALDVDGVLTDGTFWWGPDGAELKRFSFRDVMGIARARKAGIVFALISGEDTPLIDRYAEKLGITDIYKGCKDKAAALRAFATKNKLELEQVCFMGDDVNDLAAMKIAGFSAAPADAHSSVCKVVHHVTERPGGNGAVRELIELILHIKEQV